MDWRKCEEQRKERQERRERKKENRRQKHRRQGGFGSPLCSPGRHPSGYEDLSSTLNMPRDPLANPEAVLEGEDSRDFGNSRPGADGGETTFAQQLCLQRRPLTRSSSRRGTPEQTRSGWYHRSGICEREGHRPKAERRRPKAIHTIMSREAVFHLGGGMEEHQEHIPGRLPASMDLP